MTEYKITCQDCSLDVTVEDGPTKFQAIKNQAYNKVFFCPKAKVWAGILPAKAKFISLEVGPETDSKAETSWAHPTKTPVEPGSRYFYYHHKSCEGDLIPLDFFVNAKPARRCPVCNSGEMKIETLRFID